MMWTELDKGKKEKYKRLIVNFASLSEAFAQKADDEENIIAPIINSKFQESAFKRSFDATIEDIGNSSYDASLTLDNGKKFIVGIKAFGEYSGFQKIAQFKSDSQKEDWSNIIDRIKKRSLDGTSEDDEKDYLELSTRIADLRNKRIRSSKSLLRGFKFDETVGAVYHILMPSRQVNKEKVNGEPYILVGETSYSEIEIDNIKILDRKNNKKVQNFKFSDGKHIYQYNSADSQLLMSFKGFDGSGSSNAEIAVEKWPINFIENAFDFFENINVDKDDGPKVIDSVTLMINNVERRSGFNAWFGAPKNKLKEGDKLYKHIIALANEDYSIPDSWVDNFKKVVLNKFSTSEQKSGREEIREYLTNSASDNQELFNLVSQALWRNYNNPYEVYIPIPNSKKFHQKYGKFFVKNQIDFNGSKLLNKKEDRSFNIEILPSGEKMEMFINQDNGKSIQSLNSQYIFGEWVLKNVFQLKDHELLTDSRLEEIGINAIRFNKYEEDRPISMEFVYVDTDSDHKDVWK